MATAQLGTLLRHIHDLAAACGEEPRTDHQLLEAFAIRRDEAAFAALLVRHGPMVLHVCRRTLHHEQDVEDAFQATFLVLAQYTRSIRKCEALAAWLHGVAHRTALKLRRTAARRRNHEARLQELAPRGIPGPMWDDVQAVLDEEIRRLSPPLQEVFILRVLEGKSGPETAAALGMQEGTVSSRLTRARQRLRRRLRSRGIELGALLSALAIGDAAARAVLPAALARATLRFGLEVAAGPPAAGEIPSRAAALAAGVTRAMVLTKIKLATAIVLAVTLSLAGAGLVARRALAKKTAAMPAVESPQESRSGQSPGKEATDKSRPTAAAVEVKDRIVFAGRVLSPEGQPVKGARLYLLDPELKTPGVPLRARSGADGTYRFTVSRAEFDRTRSPEPWRHTPTVALAEGYGLGFPLLSADQIAADKPPPIDAITIQLAKDDVPIAGRLLDLQGKPVAGASVRVRGIRWPIKGDLTAFVQALKNQREGAAPQNQLLIGFFNPYSGWDLDGLFPPVATDAQGRFRFRGIGRERVADLLIEAPTIETKYVYVMTWPAEKVEVPAYKNPGPYSSPHQPLYTHYGATFDHVAAPSKPVIGVVRDTDTGKPIVGAVVEKSNALPVPEPRPIDDRVRFRAVTDEDGRYRITGLPRGQGNALRASPPAGQPYLMSAKEIPEEPGLEPVTVDFALKRGVWIDVKVTDKVTGQPVQCGVQYFLFDDNPHLKQVPGLVTNSSYRNRAENGTFRLVGLPGRGVVAALAAEDRYLHGIGAAKIKGLLPPRTPQTLPSICLPEQFHALAEVNLEAGAGPVTCHLVLDPGRTLAGTVVGPDGQPLAGALTSGLNGRPLWMPPPLTTAAFTVSAVKPGQSRRLLFLHQANHLAGTLLVRGDEPGPLTVKLEPWGVVTGQLVTAEGKPLTGHQILSGEGELITPEGVRPPPLDAGWLPDPVRPDKDGRFRVEGLVPGLKYRFDIAKDGYVARITGIAARNITVRSGETKDLGKIVVERRDE